jgi:glycosyltransferase involved in cell wall biosynthesis
MKIALVAHHATPPAHPVDPYSADQAANVSGLGRALAAQGHDVVIYARRNSPELPGTLAIAPRLRAEFIDAGPPAPVPADQLPQYAKDIADDLAARWRDRSPDVVHAHHWTNGLAALSATRERDAAIVQTFGSLDAAERRHRIAGETSDARMRMESCIARAVTTVLATTSDEVAELSKLAVPSPKVSLVPAGVDVSRFKPAGYVAKRRREPKLIAVGSLAEYRGLDALLRCLSELPSGQLVIAGGPSADQLESDHGYRILAKLAAHLGVADRVQFTGHVSDDALPTLLRSADLLVSAARYEPAGMTAVRAMACGIPVVATAVGAYRDAVIDGTTGLLVPPGRPEMLAWRLRDLLAYPMRMAAFGIAAADRAKSRYAWDRIASETVAVYERTIARSQSLQRATAVSPAQPRQSGSARTIRAAASTPTVRPVQRRSGARQAGKRSALAPVGGHAA